MIRYAICFTLCQIYSVTWSIQSLYVTCQNLLRRLQVDTFLTHTQNVIQTYCLCQRINHLNQKNSLPRISKTLYNCLSAYSECEDIVTFIRMLGKFVPHRYMMKHTIYHQSIILLKGRYHDLLSDETQFNSVNLIFKFRFVLFCCAPDLQMIFAL